MRDMLLVKERRTLFAALLLDVPDPGGVGKSYLAARAAFAPGNHPVDAVKIKSTEWANQRLSADEPDLRRDRSQRVDPLLPIRVLHRHAHPKIRRKRDPMIPDEAGRIFLTFGKHLKT